MAEPNTSAAVVQPDLPGARMAQPASATPAGGFLPTPNQPAPPSEALTPGMAAPDVTDRSINPTIPPAAPAGQPSKHADLLRMVQGLADGLSAAGTSIATHGREGGAAEVQQLQQGRQAASQRAEAAAQQKKSAEQDYQIKTQTLNMMNLQNKIGLAQFPDEVAKSHLSVQAETTKLAGEEFNLFAGTGMTPDQIQKFTSGGAVDSKTSNMLQANAQQSYRIASQLLSADNPSLANLKAVMNNPTSTPAALVTANNRLQSELKGQEGVDDAKIKAATAAANAPLGDKADDLNQIMLYRYQALNPKATELPKGYALTKDSLPKDFDRVHAIMQQTENAQGTQAQRDIANTYKQQMLDLMQGVKIPGDVTKQGPEYLASLQKENPGLAGTVKEIGEGRGAPPPAGSRSPAAQMLLAALNRAYPDYDATKYPAYLKARTAFTSGPEGKGVNALNTVETHLARMFAHATAAGTSGGVTGRVTGFFGDKDVRALDIDATAVSTELSKAYAAGQISEGEVKDWEDKLNFRKVGMTTGKLVNNLKEIDGLLEGKQKAYETQWETASPSASIVSPVPIISTEASAARSKIRGEGAPAETPAAKASAHNVGDSVTLKNGQSVVIKTLNPDGTFTY